MRTLEIFLTCFLACCTAIVAVPVAGWYLITSRAERCAVTNLEPASGTESAIAELAALEVEPNCTYPRDVRSYHWFLQSVTLLDCKSAGWYAVSMIAGRDKPTVTPVSRAAWLAHAYLGGADRDCW